MMEKKTMSNEKQYLGRIVAAGLNEAGNLAVMYRVSSRSFPNRQAQVKNKTVSIVPRTGHETDVFKNPYIAYNCAKLLGQSAILSNGSHTDPLAEKIAAGLPPRDALIYTLAALDYEKDDYNTPRIAVVAKAGERAAWFGVVRDNGLEVRRLTLAPGQCRYVATYERCYLSPHNTGDFAATSETAAGEFMLGGGVFANFTNPVTAVTAWQTADTFSLSALDAARENCS